MEYHRVTSGDVEIAVFTAGDGPAVLLLYGFPDDHEVWEDQISALVAAVYRLIAPDMRDCGQSAIPPEINYYRANMRMFAQRNAPKCKGMPVLGIRSDEDAYISDKPLHEIERNVDGRYRYEMISGADHWLQNDASDRVNALLLEFLISEGTAN